MKNPALLRVVACSLAVVTPPLFLLLERLLVNNREVSPLF